jgi:hypothetical protein
MAAEETIATVQEDGYVGILLNVARDVAQQYAWAFRRAKRGVLEFEVWAQGEGLREFGHYWASGRCVVVWSCLVLVFRYYDYELLFIMYEIVSLALFWSRFVRRWLDESRSRGPRRERPHRHHQTILENRREIANTIDSWFMKFPRKRGLPK